MKVGKQSKVNGCWNCLFAVREGFEQSYCLIRPDRDMGNDIWVAMCDEWQKDEFFKETANGQD